MRTNPRWTVLSALLLAGCGASGGAGAPSDSTATAPAPGPAAAAGPACDADNGGITLPEGFCALVVADATLPSGARLRHIAVEPDGDVYVAVQGRRTAESVSDRGHVLALRDTNGDGRADEQVTFGPEGGTGLEIRDGMLYFATPSAVVRYRLGAGLEPVAGPDTLVHGLPDQFSHNAKSIALGDGGALYVNIGSPTNACQPQDQDRKGRTPGLDPCPQLETRAGVWRFSAERLKQRQADGERWATGIRNAVALEWNPLDRTLYAGQHGRDQLNLWPGFTEQDNAERPAEELQRLTRGADFGWPYCFWDTRTNQRLLSPEYGGDGTQAGRCADKQAPLVAFPGHWAPNDLLFYTGTQFPERFRGGAFIAFHGSWNRAPLPQAGYNVSFVPFRDGQPARWDGASYLVFADGFAGAEVQPGSAEHRPMGLAQGPDGSLYISDSSGGRIWRVMYRR